MNCLIVLGMPRSGTTIAALLAQGLGIPMVPAAQRAIPRDRYPHGPWEDHELVEAIRRFTEMQHRDGGAAPPGQRFACHCRRDHLNADERLWVGEWVSRRAAEAVNGWWGFKVPAAASIMRPLLDCLKNWAMHPHVVLTQRSFDACVQSSKSKLGHVREPAHPSEWAAAVQAFNRLSFVRARDDIWHACVPQITLDWESLTQNPAWCAAYISRLTDLPLCKSALDLIDQSLHHSKE